MPYFWYDVLAIIIAIIVGDALWDAIKHYVLHW